MTRRLFVGALVALAVALAAVCLVLFTPPGRALLVKVGLGVANGLLPGKISVDELKRIDGSGVELCGVRIVDARGQLVVRVGHLSLDYQLRPLISGRFVVDRLELEDGFVDARELEAADHGLLSAFVVPHAPASPPSPGPPPYVRAEHIELRRVDARLPELPEIGQVDVVRASLGGSFLLDGGPSAHLEHATLTLRRGSEQLAVLDSASGLWSRGSTASEARLALRVGDARLRLSARGVLPPEPTWAERPASVDATLEGLHASDLAKLTRRPESAQAFSGELGLDLHAKGTPRALRVDAAVSSAGGVLRLTAALSDFDRARLTLVADEFRLGKVRPGLPSEPLSLGVAATAELADPAHRPWTLATRQGKFAGRPLPDVDAAGTLEPHRLTELSLDAHDGKDHLRARGDVGFDGSAALTVDVDLEPGVVATLAQLAGLARTSGRVEAHVEGARRVDGHVSAKGSVSLRQVAHGDDVLDRADLVFDASGQPPNLRGELRLRAQGARVSGERVDQATVHLVGGPSRYRSEVEAKGPDLTLKSAFSWTIAGRRHSLSGEAQGTARGSHFTLVVDETTLETSPLLVRSNGVALGLDGQTVRARGEVATGHVALDIDSDGLIDLAQLSRLLALKEPLSGRARINGRARGSLRQPDVDLRAQLERVTLGTRPAIDGDFHAVLDARAGELSFDGSLQASDQGPSGHRQLNLRAELRHHFAGGLGYEKRLLRGRPEGKAELIDLDLALVEAWTGAELPVRGHLGGRLNAGGTLGAPTLELTVRSKLRARGEPAAFDVDLTSKLEDEELVAELQVADERGPWAALRLDATTPRPPKSQDPFVERLALLPAHGRWHVSGHLEPRLSNELPVLRQRDDLPVASLDAEFEFDHRPELEPSGQLEVHLKQNGAAGAWGGCQTGDVGLTLSAQQAAGAVELRLTGRQRDALLFTSRLNGKLLLAPALAGRPVELGPLSAQWEAHDLRLETLPFVCGHARGVVDAKVELDDPLGVEPRMQGHVALREFRMAPAPSGKAESRARTERLVDVVLDAEMGAALAEARLAITPRGDHLPTSTAEARLPITWKKGQLTLAEDAPLVARVHLTHLPISPFLDPRGSVSYASGSVDGEVELTGTRLAPRFRGRLNLEQVAFTATDLAQPLREVQGRLVFSERDARLEGFEAKDGDGNLELDGTAHFERLERVDAQLHVRAQDFPLRQMGQIVATLDLDAHIQTHVLPERTDVLIRLDEADMWIENADFRSGIALDAHPDFVIDGRTADGQKAQAAGSFAARPSDPNGAAPAQGSGQSRVTYLTLESRDRFWIKRDDFAVNLSTKMDTEIADGSANVKGQVVIERGYLSLLGKTFDIERGSRLDFIGGPTPDPAIDLTAVFNNRRTGDQVKVHITGRGSAPVVEFSINDKRGEAGDAFAAIYGSQGTNQDSNSAPAQAAGFVGGLTAGLLATSARRELGAAAPIIMVEPGEKAGEGRVRAGFELDSLVPAFLRDAITGVYVEGIVAKETSGKSTSTTTQGGVRYGILLEFYYPKNLFSTAQYGPGSTWSLDLGWQL